MLNFRGNQKKESKFFQKGNCDMRSVMKEKNLTAGPAPPL